MKSYIYCFFDKKRNKIIYVGKTNGREKSYITGSKILRRYISIYGYDTFDIRFDRRIIEYCDKELLNQKEEYYIQHHNTLVEGVNLTKGGKFDWNRQNEKAVLQYDLEGNFIKEWRCGKDACIELGLNNYDGVSACCLKKQKTSGGFIWKFKEGKIKNKIPTPHRKKYKKGVKRKKYKPIKIEGEEFESITSAARFYGWSFGKMNGKIKNNQIEYEWL